MSHQFEEHDSTIEEIDVPKKKKKSKKKKHKKTLEVITLEKLRTPDGKLTKEGALSIHELCMSVYCKYMAKFKEDVELYCAVGFDAAANAVINYEPLLECSKVRYDKLLSIAERKYIRNPCQRTRKKMQDLVARKRPTEVRDWRNWLFGRIRMSMSNFRKVSLNYFAKSIYCEDGKFLEKLFANYKDKSAIYYLENDLTDNRRYSKRMIEGLFDSLPEKYNKYKEELLNCFEVLNKNAKYSYVFHVSKNEPKDSKRINALSKMIIWEAAEEEEEDMEDF